MKNDGKNLEWKVKAERQILSTKVFTINETTSVSPDGRESHFVVTDAPDWVIVVPELEGNFLMVRQWRHGSNSLSVEFPGGVIDDGESPEKAARRELKEETGFSSKKLTFLGSANPNPALMKNKVHFFTAEDLYQEGGQKLDDDEYLDFMKIPVDEVIKKTGNEEYHHALMMAALFKYMMFKKK